MTHAPGSTAPTTHDQAAKRTPINPWHWSIELGFNQGELVEGGTQVLYLAGQSAMGADGTPQHPRDMAAQVELALDNLESVLAEAGMSLSEVVRLNTYTTDIDAMFENYGLIAERLGAADVQPPGSLLGVSRLAFPELMVELEAARGQVSNPQGIPQEQEMTMIYVAIISHTPAQCPGAHDDIAESVGTALSRMEEVSREFGVTNVQFHVLLPGHDGVVILEAPDYTRARKFVMEMRLDTWNDVTLYESVTPQEAMTVSANRFATEPTRN